MHFHQLHLVLLNMLNIYKIHSLKVTSTLTGSASLESIDEEADNGDEEGQGMVGAADGTRRRR